MARRMLPRKLGHGEEATLVEHLGELRLRLIVSLVALGLAFAVIFPFHEHLVEWLMEPLPDDKRLVTLGVTEPFTTSIRSVSASWAGAPGGTTGPCRVPPSSTSSGTKRGAPGGACRAGRPAASRRQR